MNHLIQSDIDNDPTMAGNSATKAASQQATKALIATVASGGGVPPTTSASDLTSGTLDPARLPASATQNTATQTLTNKTMSGASNTFSAIPTTAITGLDTALSGKQPLNTDLTTITGLTLVNDNILQRKSGAWVARTPVQFKTDLALTKADVGLSNVDDVSITTERAATATLINKTISGSSNTFSNIPESAVTNLISDLFLMAPKASPALTGTPTAPTATLNTNTTQIATTAFVQAAVPTVEFALAQYSGTGATGSPLTIANLSGAVITSGTIPDARHSSNVPLKDATNVFSGSNTFSSITMTGGILSQNNSSGYSLYNSDGGKFFNSGQVSFGTSTTVASALLNVNSTTQGVLIPKLTTTQRDAVTSPVEGLQVFNTTTHRLNFHDGTSWQDISSVPVQVVEVTSNTQAMQPNVKYIANGSARVVFTLPSTFKVGDNFYVRGKGPNGWQVNQNASQTIHGATDSTTGTTGSYASQSRYDTIALEVITTNTDLIVIGKNGSLTVS